MGALRSSPAKRKDHVDSNKMAVLNAWRRVDCRTREALRRSSLLELIEGYEVCLFNKYIHIHYKHFLIIS